MSALALAQASQQVSLLPDPALPVLSRPLAMVGLHTYAAIWPYVNRSQSAGRRAGGRSAARLIARELILVRDDGQLLIAPSDTPNTSARAYNRHSLARLARAYSIPLAAHLADHFSVVLPSTSAAPARSARRARQPPPSAKSA